MPCTILKMTGPYAAGYYVEPGHDAYETIEEYLAAQAKKEEEKNARQSQK